MDNNLKFTSSQIKYIICIYRLSQNTFGVRNVEIANALKVSKPSVHKMLRSLSEACIISQNALSVVFFTDEGRELAQRYALCYKEIEKIFSESCGDEILSENAIYALLSEIPINKLAKLHKTK